MAQNVLLSSSVSDQAQLKRPSSFARLDVTRPRLTLDNMKHCSGSCGMSTTYEKSDANTKKVNVRPWFRLNTAVKINSDLVRKVNRTI